MLCNFLTQFLLSLLTHNSRKIPSILITILNSVIEKFIENSGLGHVKIVNIVKVCLHFEAIGHSCFEFFMYI